MTPPVSGSPVPCGPELASPEEENPFYSLTQPEVCTCIYTTILNQDKTQIGMLETIALEVRRSFWGHNRVPQIEGIHINYPRHHIHVAIETHH